MMRTLFGKLALRSPRIYTCDCEDTEQQSFSPLAHQLPERTTSELLYLETKWAALMSYGLTVDLLQEVLPVEINANRVFIPNYGDRYRYGETISTAFVESTVNQVISKRFVKKQQMRWTKRGAHLLLQIRIQVLNQDWRTLFEQWYPGLTLEQFPDALAA